MKSFLLYCIAFIGLIVAGCSAREIPSLQLNNSNQLTKTKIVAQPDEDIVTGTNLVYCSTFQLAWNELKDNIIKSDIMMQNAPPLVGLLNKAQAGRNDLPENCYVAMAGFGRDGIIDRINRALKEKFAQEKKVFNQSVSPDDIFAYAFLYKNLLFENVFDDLKGGIVFQSTQTKVKGFGIEDHSKNPQLGKVMEQVMVCDYADENDFIIRLISQSKNDEIILAKVKPGQTLKATTATVMDRINGSQPEQFGVKGGILMIPKFDFNIRHSYDELSNKSFLNKGFENYFISTAVQSILFSLNEKGCILKSEARLLLEQIKSEVREWYLVFDRPFLFCLKGTNAKYPYFVMWVDNEELMVK